MHFDEASWRNVAILLVDSIKFVPFQRFKLNSFSDLPLALILFPRISEIQRTFNLVCDHVNVLSWRIDGDGHDSRDFTVQKTYLS